MTTCVVLWATHKQAVIVSMTGGVEKILHVDANAKDGVKENGSHPRGEYYRKVIGAIQDAQEIFVFGPAEAKMALKREMLKFKTLSERVVGTEMADTMNEDQLVARAREICGMQDV